MSRAQDMTSVARARADAHADDTSRRARMNVVERAVRGGDQAQQRGAPLAFGAGVFQKCGDSTSVCQDFDADMQVLTSIVGTEIEWDLGVALPEIEGPRSEAIWTKS